LTLKVLHGQVAHARQRLIVSGERIRLSARALLRNRRDRFAGLEIRLKASKLSNAEKHAMRSHATANARNASPKRARRALVTAMQRLDARIHHSGQLLSALSYRGVLARGFALVRDEHGHAVHAAAAIGPNAPLSIEFADGRVAATADADRAAAATAASQPKPRHAKSKRSRPSAWSSRSIRAVCFSGQSRAVMPGLDPGIHQSSQDAFRSEGLPGQARQ